MCSWALQRFIWLKGNRSLSLSSAGSQKVHFFKTLWNWAPAGDKYEFPLPAISSTECTQNVHLNRVNDRQRVRGELHLRGQFSACVLGSTLHSSPRLLSFSMSVWGRLAKTAVSTRMFSKTACPVWFGGTVVYYVKAHWHFVFWCTFSSHKASA